MAQAAMKCNIGERPRWEAWPAERVLRGFDQAERWTGTPMPHIELRELLPHDADMVMRIVEDVERYPEFVPHIEAVTISSRAYSDRTRSCHAITRVRFGPAHVSYTTENVTFIPERVITIRCIEGVFSHLEGRWSFEPIGDKASLVHFRIDWEISNRLLAKVADGALRNIFGQIIRAFKERANVLAMQSEHSN